ncbi:phage tail sheath C-terminal domain-containing protein [uncultured Tateyamaria sp.]|uniref:phage tail sheath C-terminal domain-containing protein n=3 Tax=uncultured Tateyamaria sp. TaxID=455651 RepID=UPI00261A34A0|nr:phage tail sheath C-terminal domain-containing protein [uncultured Tateyamaria sp.]
MAFLHGVEVLEIDAGPRPIQTVKSSVVGIVGTAPDADADAFPLNTPVMVAGSRSHAARLDMASNGRGTLPGAMDGIFDQIGAATVVVRVEEDADTTQQLANVIGGAHAGTGQFEGAHALLGAESVLGFAPRITIAPGFTHERPAGNANPVVAEMQGICERLRAVHFADGPNTTDADAIAFAGDFGSDRIYLSDPWHKVLSGSDILDRPPSARLAGVQAKVDNNIGFWASLSNQTINGIVGTTRPVDFKLGDANSRANLLNEQKVGTTIRQNGYRTWGNRSLTDDTKWVFLSVRRTADIINDSLLRAHLWAVDRGITRTYVQDVQEGVNAYLRDLVALGAILGGKCWADPDLNSAANIQLGKVYFNFDFTPVYPAEHITFRSHLVNDYIQEVFT